MPEPRLLDRHAGDLRTRHYSPRTEEAYICWVRRFILHHGRRHPRDLGATEVTGRGHFDVQGQAVDRCGNGTSIG